MLLSENQKSILFYALEAIQKTIYFDEETNKVENKNQSVYVDLSSLSNIKSQKDLDDFIDKTLSALC